MEPGIGWELETPTMPQSPPLIFLRMSMTCSDRPDSIQIIMKLGTFFFISKPKPSGLVLEMNAGTDYFI